MTVDEILASGKYTDRRGREWVKHTYLHGSVEWLHFVTGGTYASRPDQMRLLIERDQHRDACPRLGECESHPTVHVIWHYDREEWLVYEGDSFYPTGDGFDSHTDAMDAARALAVEP